MLLKTSTENAPWIVVEGNDKYYARIKVLKTVIEAIEKKIAELDAWKMERSAVLSAKWKEWRWKPVQNGEEASKFVQKIPEIKILPVKFLTEISVRKTGQKIIRKGVYTP